MNAYVLASKEYQLLQTKYDELTNDFKKDKAFYDKALEARTNQLEELEEENEKIKAA